MAQLRAEMPHVYVIGMVIEEKLTLTFIRNCNLRTVSINNGITG